jgi:hypothetical protein
MLVASGSAAALLLAVEPLNLGLSGVWGAQALLMVGRLVTLGHRYMSPQGPLPPGKISNAQVQPGAFAQETQYIISNSNQYSHQYSQVLVHDHHEHQDEVEFPSPGCSPLPSDSKELVTAIRLLQEEDGERWAESLDLISTSGKRQDQDKSD